MFLSTEQTRAAMHGLTRTIEWAQVVRPEGRQPIPSWCKGVHVNWMDGFSNSPDVRLKVVGDVREWPDKRWAKEGDYYRARHADGRLEQYGHDGPVSLTTVKMWQCPDGTLKEYPSWINSLKIEEGEWVDVERMATTRQSGFGGSNIHLTMIDGSPLVLRGPWHVGAPAGYTEVSYVDMTSSYNRPCGRGDETPWWRRVARAGLYLPDDVFVAIVSRFAAHLEMAEVSHSGARTVEPMRPDWDAPKIVVYNRELAARRAAL